jgi:hypothetical protein
LTPLRAQILGTQTARADLGYATITATGAAPVLELCRHLIDAGIDPATPLHACRGDTLALKVKSIGAGARLTVKDNGDGPILVPYKDASAAPIRQNCSTHAPGPPDDDAISEAPAP